MAHQVLQGQPIFFSPSERGENTSLTLASFSVSLLQGLGTSTSADAKKYFSDMGKHMLQFDVTKDGDRDLIDLAFNKKKADDRKEWLRQFRVRSASSASSFVNRMLTSSSHH